MLFNTTLLPLAMTALFLSGCIATQAPKKVDEPDSISHRLAEYAESASRSQRMLAQTERDYKSATRVVDVAVSGQPAVVPRKPGQPHGLDKIIEVSWSGALDEICQRISNDAGYQFVVTGRKPPIPIIVSIATTRSSLYDALLDIAHQAGTNATVVVKVATRTVEVRYPGAR